ncbi:protein NOI4-like [Primulina eburnea]|uniref:protein NOI4-like n=1 Tax=Primulina eburnea TaxID=1245227 RepID=UPI003C6CA141
MIDPLILGVMLFEDILILTYDESSPVFGDWEKGRPLPKFGEWDVNDPASAEGFTVIFNKARDEKKTGGKPESPTKMDINARHGVEPLKPQGKKWFCCM